MNHRARSIHGAFARVALTLVIALVLAVGLAVGAQAVTDTSTYAGADGRPDIVLPQPASGSAAIAALGEHLPDVARAYGLTGAQLAQRFESDEQLTVDQNGRLFYTEAAPGADLPLGADTASSSGESAPAMVPLADTFTLHSLPGAQKVIYLDFDGAVLSDNAWTEMFNGGADIVAPSFDIDGSPGTFSDTELTRIQQVWQRVAEDYAPFAVDVTTEYPGEAAITKTDSSDQDYGMWVLISPMASYVGSCGGVAYVGVFDAVGDYCKPALVFPEMLANGEKYIAEACSHETGHTLGLFHDGTTSGVEYYSGQGSGVTGWAPIMGNGYYRELTQWSKGEYAAANNQEDDLAVMLTNGLSYRADDHGDAIGGATVLAGGGSLSVSGLIGRTGDVDVFALVSGAGELTVNVTPAERGANLDISLELLDAAGVVVASSNPSDLLTAGLTATVAQGNYFVAVRGSGKGDPLVDGYTDYASLGWYTVSMTVPESTGNVSPVAALDVTPAAGEAPLPVQFDGSSSYDPDGAVATYAWDFGDGSSDNGPAVQHTYASPGTYTARLTVTDDQGASGLTSMNITVQAANLAPTATATASPSSGAAPLGVSFDGSASTDPDGSIVSYRWIFGDGATGNGPVVQHTYSSPGTYTARLTVTDDQGATDADSVVITVEEAPAEILRVASIQVTTRVVPGGEEALAQVQVVDASGAAVPGVVVSGEFSGSVTGSATATTDVDGTATLVSKKFKTKTVAEVDFTVTGLVRQDAADVLCVDSVQITVVSAPGGVQAQAQVRVVDANGLPVSGALVSGEFSGAVVGSASGTTDAAGLVTIVSKKFKISATTTVQFTVTDILKSGYVYASSSEAWGWGI